MTQIKDQSIMLLDKGGMLAMRNRHLFLGLLLAFISVAVAAESELKDPTRPSSYIKPEAADESEQGGLNLQAVFMRESGNQAVINGELLSVGDEVAHLHIHSISQNKVQLGSGENARELILRPNILTTPKSGE